MILYLVRHGQDEDNASGVLNGHHDDHLTDLGRKQAKDVAQKLLDKNITLIYSSPLKRCLETANIIAKFLKIIDIKIDLNLIERDFGVLTQKPVIDIPKYSTKNIQVDKITFFLSGEGVESFPDLYKRAEKIYEKFKEVETTGNILAVTHGDIAKMIEAAALGITWDEALQRPYLANGEVWEIKC